jgi:hypothetical protein
MIRVYGGAKEVKLKNDRFPYYGNPARLTRDILFRRP